MYGTKNILLPSASGERTVGEGSGECEAGSGEAGRNNKSISQSQSSHFMLNATYNKKDLKQEMRSDGGG